MELRMYKVRIFFIALVVVQLLAVRKYDHMVWEIVGFESHRCNPDMDIIISSQPSSSVSPLLRLQFPNSTDCCSSSSSSNIVPPLGVCPNDDSMITHNKKYSRVEYVHSECEMKEMYRNTNCTNAIDVLAWILETLQKNNNNNNKNHEDKKNSIINNRYHDDHHHHHHQQHHLILAYGGLIRAFREKEFFINDKYIDDDFDMFVTPSTFQFLVTELEPILWNKFGWTIRIFKNCNGHAVFGQMFGACGHEYTTKASKSIQNEPSLELYPLIASTTTTTTTTTSTSNTGDTSTTQQRQDDNENTKADGVVVYNSWQGGSFPRSLIFPPRIHPFESRGVSMPLQIPRHAHELLKCWYGNWRIPSTKRADVGLKAVDTCIKNAHLNISSHGGGEGYIDSMKV